MLCNCFRLQAHIKAELFNSDHLMLLFIEVLFNPINKVPTISIAFACDNLNVFRIYAQSIHLHVTLSILYPCLINKVFSVKIIVFLEVKECLLAEYCIIGNSGSANL
jgi:hypothetical protein